MLTFFRRIRKGLLSQGYIQKYVLYAIGEIALVVIGILIALQINNWNEWKKERVKESEYITEIYQDLLRDIENLNSVVDILTEQSIGSIAYLKVYRSKNLDEIDGPKLYINIRNTAQAVPVERIPNAWDAIASTNKIEILRDKSLTEKLKKYYFTYDHRIRTFQELPANARSSLRTLLSYDAEWQHIQDIVEQRERYLYQESRLLDWIQDPEIKALIELAGVGAAQNILKYTNLKEEAASIVSYIENTFTEIVNDSK